jgi:pimeloyl-ACP methyl ester carboxylesterase
MPGDRYFQSNGARIRFRDDGKGPAILLVHGWTLDLDMWEPQVEDLKRAFRLVRFDRRGFGFSSGTSDIAQDAADAKALCRYLGIQRIALIGMSQGARVAQILRSIAPRLICCVVFDGSPDLRRGPSLTSGDIPLGLFSRMVRDEGIGEFRRKWLEHPLARLMTNDGRMRDLLDEMIGRYGGSDLLRTLEGGSLRSALGRRLPPLQTWRVPVLIINGRFDLPSRKRAGHQIALTFTRSQRVVIPRAGHLTNLDNPSVYNRVLRRFLDRYAM